MRKVSFTFDVDCTDYSNGEFIDEPRLCIPAILKTLSDAGVVRATWFVRLDAAQASRYETLSEYMISTKSLIDALLDEGHLVGWHHHSTALASQTESNLLKDIKIFGALAREMGLEMFRSGFGQMTSAILSELMAMGFLLDSSCISRPNYPWTSVPFRDWSRAPNRPYYPCRNDYQRACHCQRELIEVPITTVPLELPTDTQPGVMRYLNPALPSDAFRRGFKAWWTAGNEEANLVTVTHPFEVSSHSTEKFGSYFLSNIRHVLDEDILHVPLNGVSK